MIIFLYTTILKFCVCLTLGKMDMVLNKSLPFFSTSCLPITSFLCSAQVYSSTNAFSVPVTGLSIGMAEERSLVIWLFIKIP